ncbi:MAG: hypothetical protein XD93_0424 [candidate division WS6 bacterium 34_10]|uniref:Uncharacterized protein n=1 Tax=candidate division WS6 bacterium 34_10 TaxID=1641389 RepID=A0A101HI60_9BACT|nr:MAG: hypothetical protein XD93_0424 [candidate division WS6 bacterium 34_10]
MSKSIKVRVKIGSQKEKVVKEDDTYYVYTNSPARENRANISVIELLSDYFNIPKSYIKIKRGQKSKNKIVEIKSS